MHPEAEQPLSEAEGHSGDDGGGGGVKGRDAVARVDRGPQRSRQVSRERLASSLGVSIRGKHKQRKCEKK